MYKSTNTKIQPLIEDLGQILPSAFLTSTSFKRWMVMRKLDGVWSMCLEYIKDNRNYVLIGFDNESSDAKDALGYLIENTFEQQRDKLPSFLFELLSFYVEEKSEYVDVTEIKKDLLAAGYSKDVVTVFDRISIPEHLEEIIQEEQTQEQIVRSFEKDYVAITEENSRASIDAYLKWHSAALQYLSNYYSEANPDYAAFKHLDNSGNGYTLHNNYKSIYSVYNLLMNNVTTNEIVKTASFGKKTPMVFISHSHGDESFVVALVNLLEDMGFSKDNLFCSSVREYGIPLSGDIFDTIRGLFLEHDLYVIFVHSPRFYGSPVSLNEMGAAWVLKTDFCSFLTNDMDYGKMKGVVNNAKISIKVSESEAPALLNELYKHLAAVFSLQEMDMNKWERKRDQFLAIVRNIKNEEIEDAVQENDVDREYKKLQIEKMKAEAEARHKAIIRGNIIRGFRGGSSTLKIFNAGAAVARNVRVEWLNQNDNVMLTSDFSEIGELTPQNSRSYTLHLTNGHPETMNLRYSWDDDYATGNQLEESLQL